LADEASSDAVEEEGDFEAGGISCLRVARGVSVEVTGPAGVGIVRGVWSIATCGAGAGSADFGFLVGRGGIDGIDVVRAVAVKPAIAAVRSSDGCPSVATDFLIGRAGIAGVEYSSSCSRET
jgi:hypothetical protein